MTTIKSRLQIAATKKTGYFWGGKPCKAFFYRAMITKNDKPLYWGNAFAGKQRQIIEIVFPSREPFYIDNEDGTGYHMITAMKGNVNSFRRGVLSPILLSIEKPNQPNNEKYHETEGIILEWLKENHHEYYLKSLQKMEAMKRNIPKIIGATK